MIGKVIKKFKQIDIFGKSVELTFNNKTKHKTIIGAFITFLISLVALIAIIFLLQEIILHRNPNIIVYQEDSQQDSFTLNPQNLLFAIEIEGDNNEQIKLQQLIKIQIQLTKYAISSQKVFNKLDTLIVQTEFCNFSNLSDYSLDDNTVQYFQNMQNKFLICLSQNNAIQLLGNEKSSEMNSLDILIQLNDEINANNTQFNQIIKLINSRRIIFHYINSIIYPQIYNTPVVKKGVTISKSMDIRFNRLIKLEVQEVIIYTDNGLVFNEYSPESHYQVNYKIDDFQYNCILESECSQQNSLTLFQFRIQNSADKQIFQRKYIKIYTLFGLLGGIIKLLVLIGYIITRPITDLSFHISIVNKIFDFQQYDASNQSPNPPSALRKISLNTINNKSQSMANGDDVDEIQDNENNNNNEDEADRDEEVPGDEFANSNKDNKDNNNNKQQNNIISSENQIQTTRGLKEKSQNYNFSVNQIRNNYIKNKSMQSFNINNEITSNNNQDEIQQITQNNNLANGNNNTNNINLRNKTSSIVIEQFNQQKSQLSCSPDCSSIRKKSSNKTIVIQKMLNKYAKNQEQTLNDKEIIEIKTTLQQTPSTKTKDKNKILSKLFQKEKTIFVQLADYVLYYFRCLRDQLFYKNKKYLKKSFKKVKSRMDLHYILNKLVEIDKLKMLFLDENQIRLFEYLPKPIIYMNTYHDYKDNSNMQSAWNFLQRKKNQAEKAGEAYKAFISLTTKQQLTKLDKKLMDMIDDKIKYYFDGSIHRKSFIIDSNQLNNFQMQIQQQIAQPNAKEDTKIPREKRKTETHLTINSSTFREFNKFKPNQE